MKSLRAISREIGQSLNSALDPAGRDGLLEVRILSLITKEKKRKGERE
jgi:hypothetical protein